VEGYPGPVVHGPLQTVLMLDLARRQEPRPVKRLEYRALRPLFHFERFTVNGNPAADASKAELRTAHSAGNYALTGTAYF
jgi:3-methylfumaryl-CoA hydratase